MKKMERETVFYKKLFELMIPIMLQDLMLALVAVADAFMLGGVDQNYMRFLWRHRSSLYRICF